MQEYHRLALGLVSSSDNASNQALIHIPYSYKARNTQCTLCHTVDVSC